METICFFCQKNSTIKILNRRWHQQSLQEITSAIPSGDDLSTSLRLMSDPGYVFLIYLYNEHQWKVTTDSCTLNIGAHLDLSGQRNAVCSAFIYVVYSPMNRYYRKQCSAHMTARYPFTNENQMFPLSSMGTCQVMLVPESLSLACSIWRNNPNHFDAVFKEYLSGIHWHVCFWK